MSYISAAIAMTTIVTANDATFVLAAPVNGRMLTDGLADAVVGTGEPTIWKVELAAPAGGVAVEEPQS